MADEGFLQRWSRRKAEARDPQNEPAAAPLPEAAPLPKAPEREAGVPVDRPAAEDTDDALDLAALPDIDSLTYESDFTVFMRKGVPPELRKRALQRLWRSNSTLANLDGLVDYAEDYNRSGTATAVVRTAYQVGRGMLERVAAPPSGEGDARAAVGAAGAAPAELPDAPVAAASGAEPAALGAAGEAPAGPAGRPDGAPAAAPDATPSQAPTQVRPLPRRP